MGLPVKAYGAVLPLFPMVGAIAIPGPGLLSRFSGSIFRVAAISIGLALYTKGHTNLAVMMAMVACIPYPYNFIYPLLFGMGLSYMG
jgi:hypothetical protein